MNKSFAVVDDSSGEIVADIVADEEESASLQAGPGQSLVGKPPFGVGHETHFFDKETDTFVERPEMDLEVFNQETTVGGSPPRIEGIPEGMEIRRGGNRFVADADGIYILATQVAGIFVVEISGFPFKKERVELVVRES